MGNVLLTLGRKRLLVPRTASKRYDNHFSLFGWQPYVSKGAGGQESASKRKPGGSVKKVPAGGGEPPNEFLGGRGVACAGCVPRGCPLVCHCKLNVCCKI